MLFRPLSGKYNYGLGQTQWAKMCEACCEFKLALYFFIIAINPPFAHLQAHKFTTITMFSPYKSNK